ncbi:MAG: zf-HC2 domain-containing protein [Oscillospiraceae bacterium]|nr:zf-HC2 domain-containing protein [Oscillospiraceae bacterium]
MNMTCKVAMDLAELYKSDLVSAETADAIHAHLKTCPDCRRYYREYDMHERHGDVSIPAFGEDLEGMETRLYRDLSKRLAHRRVLEIVGTSAAIGAGTIMLAIGILMMTKKPDRKL